MTSLRITLVTETYFPQVNGVSRTLDRLVRHCAEQGDRLQLLLPRYPAGPPELPAGVEMRTWKALPLPFYPEVVLPLARARGVRASLADFRPDLVHVATEGILGRAALSAAESLGVPVVSSYHTNFPQYMEMYGAGFLAPLTWRYLRSFHNRTRRTFCPTPSTARLLEARGFRDVEVWGRGVDSERFHPHKRDLELRRSLAIADHEVVLAYAGRLATEKNLETLMAAWNLLPEELPCRLLLIGDGPLRRRLEERASPRVIFAGYRHGEELARIYASADLFVFPSLSETFGNVILEAMASGLPAIGFAVQGPGDIIRDGETGRLVPQGAAAPFSAAMLELIRRPEQRRAMGEQARRYAEGQSWSSILGQLRSAYVAHCGAA